MDAHVQVLVWMFVCVSPGQAPRGRVAGSSGNSVLTVQGAARLVSKRMAVFNPHSVTRELRFLRGLIKAVCGPFLLSSYPYSWASLPSRYLFNPRTPIWFMSSKIVSVFDETLASYLPLIL